MSLQPTVDALIAAAYGHRLPEADISTAAELIRDVHRGCNATPVTRYMAEIQTAARCGYPFRLTEPWQAIADKQLAAAAMAFQTPEIKVLLNDEWPSAGLAMASLTLQATPYLWRETARELAITAPLPKHVIANDIAASPVMFWSYETSRQGEAGRSGVNWLLAAAGSAGLFIAWDIVDEKKGRVTVAHFVIPYGETWPSSTPRKLVDIVGTILKQCAFLRAPFVESRPEGIARPLRREMQRKDESGSDETIRVVKLRRPFQREDAIASNGTGRDRHHQWWVSGHYRAQWYPSMNAHKVIYIAPHLKGPEGKPLLTKIYDVFR